MIGKIELLVGGFQFDKKIENHIEHFVRPRVFPVDLVDDDDRFCFVLHRLAQNKARLRLRSIVRVDHEQHAVDHLHDALDFAAEIGVTGRVDDVDAITVPLKRGVLRANGDSLFRAPDPSNPSRALQSFDWSERCPIAAAIDRPAWSCRDQRAQ